MTLWNFNDHQTLNICSNSIDVIKGVFHQSVSNHCPGGLRGTTALTADLTAQRNTTFHLKMSAHPGFLTGDVTKELDFLQSTLERREGPKQMVKRPTPSTSWLGLSNQAIVFLEWDTTNEATIQNVSVTYHVQR